MLLTQAEPRVLAEVRRLDRHIVSPESELFVTGAKLAIDWLQHGGISPAEWLDARFLKSTLEQ